MAARNLTLFALLLSGLSGCVCCGPPVTVGPHPPNILPPPPPVGTLLRTILPPYPIHPAIVQPHAGVPNQPIVPAGYSPNYQPPYHPAAPGVQIQRNRYDWRERIRVPRFRMARTPNARPVTASLPTYQQAVHPVQQDCNCDHCRRQRRSRNVSPGYTTLYQPQHCQAGHCVDPMCMEPSCAAPEPSCAVPEASCAAPVYSSHCDNCGAIPYETVVPQPVPQSYVYSTEPQAAEPTPAEATTAAEEKPVRIEAPPETVGVAEEVPAAEPEPEPEMPPETETSPPSEPDTFGSEPATRSYDSGIPEAQPQPSVEGRVPSVIFGNEGNEYGSEQESDQSFFQRSTQIKQVSFQDEISEKIRNRRRQVLVIPTVTAARRQPVRKVDQGPAIAIPTYRQQSGRIEIAPATVVKRRVEAQ